MEHARTHTEDCNNKLRTIALDTVKRSEAVIKEHRKDGATVDSTFIAGSVLSKELQRCISFGNLQYPDHRPTPVNMVAAETFAAAKMLMREFPEEAPGKVAVLNMASDELPGGGWLHELCRAQEDALCYSSTLYVTLKPTYFPWPNIGPGSDKGIFSPGIVVFKDELARNCVDLHHEDRIVVSVISVAAPRKPKLTADGLNFERRSDLNDLRRKIRLIYRMAIRYGQEFLVLGAMGCGVYRCPPRLVAEQMRDILLETEFKGWFRWVGFAIRVTPANGGTNYNIFKDVFKDVEV